MGILNYLLASKVGGIPEAIERRKDENFVEFKIPFNSSRKRQITAVKFDDDIVRVYVMGAPDRLLPKCVAEVAGTGGVVELHHSSRQNIEKTLKAFADKTYRTILCAHVDYPVQEWIHHRARNNDLATV